MTLQSSGSISLSNVDVELGRASNAGISLNESASRSLAGVASGAISLSSFYGKTRAAGYSPVPGTYDATDNATGGASFTITSSSSVTWIWSKTGATQISGSIPSGSAGTAITFSLPSAATTANRSGTVTITGPASWTITMFASGNDGGGVGCVTVDTLLPGIGAAHRVNVGDYLQVGNPLTFATRQGLVSRADVKPEMCVRIETISGITLECSMTAPIATQDGSMVLAPELEGHFVPVYDNGDTRYELVTSVEPIGTKDVVHITCENDVFLAGAQEGRYLLHHNIKQ
jgi:hypothetical protein